MCTYVEAGATRRSSTSFRATGVRLSELANIVYDPERPDRNVVDLVNRELRMYGEGRKDRIVKFGDEAPGRSIATYASATPTLGRTARSTGLTAPAGHDENDLHPPAGSDSSPCPRRRTSPSRQPSISSSR